MPATVPGQLTVNQDSFPGLRLDVDPLELAFNGAIDLLNVEFARDGGLLARHGFQRWGAATSDLGSPISWLWSDGASDVVVIYGAGPVNYKADLVDREAGTTTTSATTTGPSSGAVMYAGPNPAVYTCNPLELRRLTPAAGLVATAPSGAELVDKTPWDNRMMLIGTVVGPTGDDQIYFSDPDDATTWGTDNWVNPAPQVGGAKYTASARWREMVFVFRQSAFIVFTGTSSDNTGGPVFDYRVVDYGVGAATLHGACASPEGVYFLDTRGVFLTRGGAPELVSDSLRALFRDDGAASEFTAFGAAGGRIDFSAPASMVWRQERLYIAVGTVDSLGLRQRRMLTYDTATKHWTISSIGGVAIAAADPVNEAILASIGVGFVNSGLWVAGPTVHGATDDDSVWRMIPDGGSFGRGQDYSVAGAALQDFAWRYRTGYHDFSAPGEKTLRRMLFDGTGTITRKLYDERNTQLAYADETVALGAARVEEWARKAGQGRGLSLQLSGNGAFSVNRISHHVQGLRGPLLDDRS